MSKPILGYWDTRGLVQPIRTLLHHLNIDYTAKEYVLFQDDQWKNDKFNIGLDFPNLPYYFDGDLKLTQSLAILKHIAREHDLVPTNEEELTLVEMMEGVLNDYRQEFTRLCYNPKFHELKDEYRTKSLPVQNQHLDKYLEGKKWSIGEKLTYMDFLLYELLIIQYTFDSATLSTFPNLKRFCLEFRKLPGIIQSEEKFASYPMTNKIATFKEPVKSIDLEI